MVKEWHLFDNNSYLAEGGGSKKNTFYHVG